MQIVIDIPDRIFKMVCNNHRMGVIDCDVIHEAIANGTPLPKGHGKLKDVSKIEYRQGVFIDSEGVPLPIVHKIATIEMIRDWLPTIIETDKAEEEK